MKLNEKRILTFKFVNILLTILFFSNIICFGEIERSELKEYFKPMTIDRIRQIYWNIVCDIDKNYDKILFGSYLDKKEVEQNLHSFTREMIIENLYYSLSFSKIDYYLDIEEFKKKQTDEKYDLFSEKNYKHLISVDMPKNFLVNFAINIDKYERKQNKNIDGVNDYINYLTKGKIVEYLINKLNEYSELNYYVKFKEIVLNNVDLYYEDIDEYLKTLSKRDLIDIIYGYENYFFNILDYSEITEYNYYQHEDIEEKQEKELILFINSFNKEAGITTLDDLISKIENRYINYTNSKIFFENMNDTELENNLFALEKYHKRQMNITKSLRGLNDYIKYMKRIYKIRTLTWGLNMYPELYEPGRFQDIISNEINLQYGEVKEFVHVTERSVLLRYAYNIHTYQNNIESLNDESLYILYRFKNEKLYELILSDVNSNKNLQVKSDFLNVGDFYKDDFCKYLETLERNQLKKFVLIFINLYFNELSLDDYKKASEKLTRIELTFELDTPGILDYAQYFVKESLNIKTSNFFLKYQDYLKKYIYKYFGYFNNIMDFLRSTNIFYLKLWLRKYESIIRKKKLYTNIAGGMQNDLLNEYTKKEILELFDIYLEEYPELFTPRKFIEISGLDNGMTPHKKLVELFEDLNQNNANIDTIMKIVYSLIGHYQRKNIQTSFNVEKFIDEIKYNLNSSDYNIDFNNKYLFQLFRIINIFPELSNSKLFKYLCEDPETRVINLYENGYLLSYSQRHISQIAKNIQYYLNNTMNYDQKLIDTMNDEELKKYILDFTENPQFKDNIELKSRILDGDFYPIIYDYFEFYLNGTDEDNLNFIYSNLKKKCGENYPCNNFSDSSSTSNKLKEIVNDIKNVQEFQNPNFFDKFFDYIPDQQKDALYEFLFNSTIRDLKYYTIIANILKIETCEKDPSIEATYLPKDIFLKIHYMSKNEMIKYILKVRKLDVYHISIEMLPLLVKYYMIDIGSDNIYDLSLF